jgi:hypothetical protein
MENDELNQIVKESAANAQQKYTNLSQADMLKKLAQDHLDNDVKLKHEKAFIKKLKIWHENDMI